MQNIIITGAAGGIGTSLTYKFVNDECRVFLVDRDPTVMDLADAINAEKGENTARAIIADLADSAQAQAACLCAAEYFEDNIDVLVNNAGTLETREGVYPTIEMLTDEIIQTQFANNVYTVFYMIRGVVPFMRKRGSGTIINVGSVSACGLRVNAHYSASKSAVHGLTKSLALELAPEITVIGVAPGLVKSQMIKDLNEAQRQAFVQNTAKGELLECWEVANLIRGFSHPDSRNMHGQIVHMNAGHVRQMFADS